MPHNYSMGRGSRSSNDNRRTSLKHLGQENKNLVVVLEEVKKA